MMAEAQGANISSRFVLPETLYEVDCAEDRVPAWDSEKACRSCLTLHDYEPLVNYSTSTKLILRGLRDFPKAIGRLIHREVLFVGFI